MKHQINRLPQVIKRTGKSRPSIYRDMKSGNFPLALSLGSRSVGWLEAEIDAWIENRKRINQQYSASPLSGVSND